MRRVMENPRKSIELLGVSPQEFQHLFFFSDRIIAAGSRNEGTYCECKVPIDIRLYILLFCLSSEVTM